MTLSLLNDVIESIEKHINDDAKQEIVEWKDISEPWKQYDMDVTVTNRRYRYRHKETEEFKLHHVLQKLKDFECEYFVNHKNGGSVTFFPSPFLSKQELGTQLMTETKFIKSKQYHNILKQTKCTKLEAIFDSKSKVITAPNDLHAFIVATEVAYFMHYPLRITPSHIWLLILHSIATHIEHNAEKLRHKFVVHQGKKVLTVERPDFVKGSQNNEWDQVIVEFAQQIDKNTVKDTVPLLECNFSTTNKVERIAGKVAIMDICQHYFEYEMGCGCGFPQITLDGNQKDWKNLKSKCIALLNEKCDKEFADRWRISLIPILDRFIEAYDGKIDCLFWNSMVRRGAIAPSSGWWGLKTIERRRNVFYSGWFNILFPFNGSKRHNYLCKPYAETESYVADGLVGENSGNGIGTYSYGISSAPVKYIDYLNGGKIYDMKFIAGFIGCEQDPKTLEISPKIGWMIGEQ